MTNVAKYHITHADCTITRYRSKDRIMRIARAQVRFMQLAKCATANSLFFVLKRQNRKALFGGTPFAIDYASRFGVESAR
jgi:hypothetical protein